MKPRLIGLAGRARSGKDTVAGMIFQGGDQRSVLPVQLASFAGPLKEFCRTTFDFNYAQIFGDDKEKPDLRYPRPDGTYLTPREAMQQLGTNWGRACYPNVWVDLGIRLAKQELNRGYSVVFTDVRFANEAKAIHQAGGEVWRVYRKAADDVPATHPSETEMDTPPMEVFYTHTLSNNGTLEELRAMVEGILRRG